MRPVSFHAHHSSDHLVPREGRILPETVVAPRNDLDLAEALPETHDAVGCQPACCAGEHDLADEEWRRTWLYINSLAVTNRRMHGVAAGHESRRVTGVEDGPESRLEHVRPPSPMGVSG